VTSTNGKTNTTSGIMARASDGSTYTSFSDPNYPTPDHVVSIEIDDLKNNRHIGLHPGSNGRPFIQPRHYRTFSVQKNAEMMQQLQASFVERPDRAEADGQVHITSLGAKQQDGMTLFGHKSEFTSNKGDKRIQEIWWSDLGIAVTTQTIWPAENREYTVMVTDIQRTEPDPALFQIPENSRPPS
jgi:hypothetical protein